VLDHVGIEVGDFDRSRAFYEMALAPLGLEVLIEPLPQMAGFGAAGKHWFWRLSAGRSARLPPADPARIATLCPGSPKG
jgi:catechol 2,3-dioxygenase-like lactoylglutathione lyase family enzyme